MNQEGGYQDVSDVFYADPLAFLQNRFAQQVDPTFPPLAKPMQVRPQGGDEIPWPSHLVTFEALHGVGSDGKQLDKRRRAKGMTVEKYLRLKGYTIVHQRWNSIKHEDPRRDGRIVVWQWRK